MSNFLAIATVTATLKNILLPLVQRDVSGSNVTIERPDGQRSGDVNPRVNIYLYQVTPNVAYRNTDLPTRRSNSQLIQRPRAALDLHYLLSFYGDDNRLEQQRLMGSVVRTIHSHPVLTRESIRQVIASPEYNYLASSNLADDIELVKFTPASMTLEELSKLWSVFFQIPYALSVAFQATVVLIESEASPHPTLPVRERRIKVLPFRDPFIENVHSDAGIEEPIILGSTLKIIGKNFSSDDTRVRIMGQLVPPDDITDTQIKLILAQLPFANELQAGIQGIRVAHVILNDNREKPLAFESNVGVFILRPNLQTNNISYDPNLKEITINSDLTIGTRQRVELLLTEILPNNTNEAPRAYTVTAKSRLSNTKNVRFSLPDIEDGEFLVRLRIDGFDSPLIMENGKFIGPTVTLGTASYFTLTTRIDPVEGGNIVVTPQRNRYLNGTEVRLESIPNQGFKFSRWSGHISGADPQNSIITLVMNRNRSVAAKFDAIQTPQYRLQVTVNPEAAGVVRKTPNQEWYDEEQQVEITAEANPDFEFDRWSGDIDTADPNDSTIILVMDKNRSITAKFTQVQITQRRLTTRIDPADGGTIIVNPDQSIFDNGAEVDVTAEASAGFEFDQWTGDIGNADASNTNINLVMDRDRSITAKFVVVQVQQHSLTTVTDPPEGGQIVKDPDKTIFNHNEEVQLTAEAHPDFEFDIWKGHIGNADAHSPSITLVMDKDRSVKAKFSQISTQQYKLTTNVQPSDAGTIVIEPEKDSYSVGELVQLSIEINSGFEFAEWQGDIGTANPTDLSIQLTMDQDRNVTALLAKRQWELNIQSEPEAGGTVHADPEKTLYDDSEEVELEADPNENFEFAEWSGDLEGSENPTTVIMDGDKNIIAHFSGTELKEIYSGRIELRGRQVAGRILVGALVFVRDEDMKKVEGAKVIAKWTLPDTSEKEDEATTDDKGQAVFDIENGEGKYIFKVTDIQKSGYEFHPEQGDTEEEIII